MAVLPETLFDTALHFSEAAYRNFVSLRKSRNLFARLADDETDTAVATAAEMATKPRRSLPAINRPFEPWYGVIGFPFEPRHWATSRFSDGTFGVWYGSRSIETTVHETVHHFRQELAGRGWNRHDRPILRERCVKTAQVDALVFDMRGKQALLPGLTDAESYAFTHEVGRAVHQGRHPGLLVTSARDADGDNVDIFAPDYLSDPRDCCYLTYRHQPDGQVDVERQPGRVWMRL